MVDDALENVAGVRSLSDVEVEVSVPWNLESISTHTLSRCIAGVTVLEATAWQPTAATLNRVRREGATMEAIMSVYPCQALL